MPARAAIQYSRESFDTRVGEMMGRRMAGETFLKAWIEHGEADPLTAWVHSQSDGEAFEPHARELGATGRIAVASLANLAPLRDAQTLWLADPALARHSWERRWFQQDGWSIVGITHTISSGRAVDAIAGLLTAPVQPWDALICTSRAVRRTVQTLLEQEAAYLRARLGATTCTGPELPVIPLGVPCDALAPDPAARARWRAELGIADDDVAILQFGRLSLHLKAHPLPLFLALRRAALKCKQRLHLILAGQPTNPGQDAIFRTLAAEFADQLTTHFVDGARADAGSVRSAADIFTLLSDNIQESYGMAPVEAMAAGLPVVGSDWDGLRDTIEHGVTGLLVDSILPAAGTGEIIARRHAFEQEDYHHYLGHVAQLTAIDVDQAAQAFATLAADPALRRRMGEAGRKRARALFDWSQVIRAHRALIKELGRIRAGAAQRAARTGDAPAQPARMDPFRLFGAYPSARLAGSTMLRIGETGRSVHDLPGGFRQATLVAYGLPAPEILDAMLARVAQAPVTLLDLVAGFPGEDRRHLVGGVAFLLKMGLIGRA
jgi:glycosyltransferase involved in cell wall biosynthesis